MATVIVETDGDAPRVHRIERFPCRIGRSRDSDIVLRGWRVAREHAELQRFDDGYRVVDSGSLAGTWVNGDRIVEFGPLDERDEIVIAGYRLIVHRERRDARRQDHLRADTRDESADADLDAGARAGVDVGTDPRTGASASTLGSDAQTLAHDERSTPTMSPLAATAGGSTNTGAAKGPAAAVAPDVASTVPEQSINAHSPRSLDDVGAGTAGPDDEIERQGLEWRRLVHRRLLQAIDLHRRDIRQLSPAQLRLEVRGLLVEVVRAESALPERIDRSALIDAVLDEAVGLGPLEVLLADESVSEIMVNGPHDIFVERHGILERSAASFSDDQAVRAAIDRIVGPIGRRIDEASPMVDARLPDGSRVNAVIPPLALRGSTITIRRFNRRLLTPQDLVAIGTLSEPMLEFLQVCVKHRRNIVVSGGTGSGKTTLLNVLSNLIPAGERVITIEDAAELRLAHQHLVALEARPANVEGRGLVTIRDLVRNALRMRPDRIVVGECRGGEALDMLQAMNTGHDGSLTTVHANGARDVLSRLETMVLMAGVDMPVVAIREQVASAIGLVVHQTRFPDGRRRVTEIAEFTGMEGGRVSMQSLFRFQRFADGGRFVGCGNVPHCLEALREVGAQIDLAMFQQGDEHRA